MDTEIPTTLSLNDICHDLGVLPHFVSDLGANAASYYQSFDRPKRSGGFRKISASQGRLKRIQRLLLDELLSKFKMPLYLHGCIKHRSIATNASAHVNHEVVINIDLSNFFGTISADVVSRIFESKFNCAKEAALVLTKLTTFQNCLPQGAPTSPVLANIATLDLDDEIIRICRERVGAERFSYSRYVDDITISGGGELVDLIQAFDEAITNCGFKTNAAKTKILRKSTRQWVTGLVVNKRLTAPKGLLRYVRQQLYYCKRYGLDAHCDWRGLPSAVFVRKLRGTIGYIRMSQPGLADEFQEKLDEILPPPESKAEELRIKLLKRIIDDERTAKFIYRNSQRRVGLSEIFLDDDGIIKVRGFQISPEVGWETFELSEITELEVEAHVS